MGNNTLKAQETPSVGVDTSNHKPKEIDREIAARLLIIKDELLTSEDWIEDKNYKEARYFLSRLQSEVQKLDLCLKAKIFHEIERPS